MKNLIISLVTLLIFTLTITDYVIITEAQEETSVPVLDTSGDELRAGYRYIIRSVFRPGGGVSAYPLSEENCTFAVFQQVFGDGFPVIFRPPGSEMGDVINESTDLSIKFPDGIVCGPSTVWKVEYDESAQTNFVLTGGNETISNLFRIEKVSNGDYKFVFCTKFSEYITICTDVGIFYQDNIRRLALSESGRTFSVMFERLLVGHTKY